ncbi:hypothetical protein CASFOL_005277 [Castilleja foliolosa]|uniref:Reverse transcriptase zinc-binding domain-containing protein n=1 Tax=Castilleja foliolosa TaxID=1961234 RepID=A0ABD3E708_9LAMI
MQECYSAMEKSYPTHSSITHQLAFWQIGRGAISFWHNNWLGEALNPMHKSRLTVQEALKDNDFILANLSQVQLTKAKSIIIDPDANDRLIFVPSSNGNFNIQLYIQATNLRWSNYIWNSHTPYRVNSFMWRLIRSALPTDDRIQRKGITLVSRCSCCVIPQNENVQHLFLKSEMAATLWDHFGKLIRKPTNFNSVWHLLKFWSHGSSRRSQMGILILGVIFYGCWNIWKERCRLRYDEGR